jgi:hypothetical protein
MKKKTITKKIILILPLFIVIGCSKNQSSSIPSQSIIAPPVTDKSKLLISESSIIQSNNSSINVEDLDYSGNLNESDSSQVTAALYTDSGCTQAIQQLSVSCGVLSQGQSTCEAPWLNQSVGSYFFKAQSSSGLSSSCAPLSIGELQISNIQTNVDGVIGQSNGYNIVTTADSEGNYYLASIETVTGLEYQIQINSSAITTTSVQSSIGSTVSSVILNNLNQSVFNYSVGLLTAATTDYITVTDQNGLNRTIVVNLTPSMLLSSPDLQFSNQLTLNLVSGSTETISVLSGGTAPYTYTMSVDGGIGSTFISGVYTAGTVVGNTSVSEQLQVIDSLGNAATIFSQITPHIYSVNAIKSGGEFSITGTSSINLIAQKDSSSLATTIGQWSISGVMVVDQNTQIQLAGYTDPNDRAIISGCFITEDGNLSCSISTQGSDVTPTSDLFEAIVTLTDQNGTSIFNGTMLYSSQ